MSLNDSVDNLIRRQHQASEFEALMKMRTDVAPQTVFINSPAISVQCSLWQLLAGSPATGISYLQSILHNASKMIFLKCPFDHVISLCDPPQTSSHL